MSNQTTITRQLKNYSYLHMIIAFIKSPSYRYYMFNLGYYTYYQVFLISIAKHLLYELCFAMC